MTKFSGNHLAASAVARKWRIVGAWCLVGAFWTALLVAAVYTFGGAR